MDTLIIIYMMPINTQQQLVEYKKTIERQKEVLEMSTAFSELEKFNLKECYEYQIAICDAKIANQLEVIDAINA